MTPNLTAFTGVDSQNLPDVMVSVQFILAIGEVIFIFRLIFAIMRVLNADFLKNIHVVLVKEVEFIPL
ncbi:hypothetical protein [Lactobacillus delbrueckii]|uniref:hypothetical protein n=1 Tax=Lactobacillus delbrueckii TaxID=1584 RepID=UPI001E3A012C|nr:hypothetical protein [Lactobacillus delbrueckii]MCD5565989.1 hypothetical protein [Lactobacillus delbrueckii subsp. lactis]